MFEVVSTLLLVVLMAVLISTSYRKGVEEGAHHAAINPKEWRCSYYPETIFCVRKK